MKRLSTRIVLASMAANALSTALLFGQTREAAIVGSATSVLDEIMAVPVSRIPRELLADAKGVAIVPGVVKIGFVGAVRRGHGVLLVRDARGAWAPPQFVTLTGGSVGWQVGIQATDIILVFKSQRSIEGLMQGKFTLGADVAVAAGPVGRQAAAGTDAALRAEIYSYSKSRGLFAGVSLDGSAVTIDAASNLRYYHGGGVAIGTDRPGQVGDLPESAVALIDRLTRYTAVADAGNAPPIESRPAGDWNPVKQDRSVRGMLAVNARQLYQLLDDRWKQYFDLPADLFVADRPLNAETVRLALARFDTVAQDPRYHVLTGRPEFKAVHKLLRETVMDATSDNARLSNLPPPPSKSSLNPAPALR